MEQTRPRNLTLEIKKCDMKQILNITSKLSRLVYGIGQRGFGHSSYLAGLQNQTSNVIFISPSHTVVACITYKNTLQYQLGQQI